MSNQELKDLKELVEVLHDGVHFYREAYQKVSDSTLKEIFSGIATNKERLVNRLQPLIEREEHEQVEGHNFAVKIRETYTNILGSLQEDNAETYINNLEQVEDKTRDKVREALENVSSTSIAIALREVYPYVKLSHDEMSSLKAARV